MLTDLIVLWKRYQHIHQEYRHSNNNEDRQQHKREMASVIVTILKEIEILQARIMVVAKQLERLD